MPSRPRAANPADGSPLVALALVGAGAGLLYYLTMEPSVSDKVSFVKKFGPIDLAISKREGFIPGILTGWAAMESAWATSGLAKQSNNLFGIKAGPTWRGQKRPFVEMPTKEFQGTAGEQHVTAAFRAYPSWEDSANDLVSLLKIEGVYHGALDALKRKDVVGFLKGIAASGYSTAKDYDARIMNFLRDISTLKIA